jgi:hypothetical protein
MSNRGESIRLMQPLFQEGEGGSTPTSPLHLFFGTTDRDTFKRLNLLWHSRLPKIGASQGRVFYHAQHSGVAYAVAMWSNPVARLLPQLEWLELRRLAISDDAPKNTASRFLGWMARDVRSRFPQVVRLISYQDCEVHQGTIYKASGWSHAKGYKGRKRGWESGGGGGRKRIGRTNQAISVRMRWELIIR